MGDIRFQRPYDRVCRAPNRAQAIRSLGDEEVVAALAAAAKHHDPYLANVLATEAQNRVNRKTLLLNHVAEGVYVLDHEGVIVAANPRLGDLLGHATGRMVGRNIHALAACVCDGAKDRSLASCPALHTVRTGLARACDARYRRGDGRDVVLSLHALPLRRNGDPWRAVVILRSPGERPPGTRTAIHLPALFDASPDAILVRSPDGIITHWNAAATRMFGYTADEAIGQHVWILIPPELRALEQRLRARVLAGESIGVHEARGVRKDGRKLVLSLTLSPVRNDTDGVVAVASIIRDVSGQKAFEQQLKAMTLAGFVFSLAAAVSLLRSRE